MNEDELILLARSYADEVARSYLGALRVEVTGETDEHGDPWADVAFIPTGPEGAADAVAARGRCVGLIDADKRITCPEEWEDEKDSAACLAVVGVSPDEFHREDSEELGPGPAEDEELASQLEMPEGPLAVTVEGLPAPVPGVETRFVVVGLNLEGRGWTGKVYKSGKVADPERASYWALKHERAHKDHGFRAATSVVYQVEMGEEELLKRVLSAVNGSA